MRSGYIEAWWGVARACPIDVFDYLDYRAFLRDYYVAKKGEGKGFSYRAFSMGSSRLGEHHEIEKVARLVTFESKRLRVPHLFRETGCASHPSRA